MAKLDSEEQLEVEVIPDGDDVVGVLNLNRIIIKSSFNRLRPSDFSKTEYKLGNGKKITGKEIASYVLGRTIPKVDKTVFLNLVRMIPLKVTMG